MPRKEPPCACVPAAKWQASQDMPALMFGPAYCDVLRIISRPYSISAPSAPVGIGPGVGMSFVCDRTGGASAAVAAPVCAVLQAATSSAPRKAKTETDVLKAPMTHGIPSRCTSYPRPLGVPGFAHPDGPV